MTSQSAPRRKASLRAKLLLFSGSLVFALVVAEVALRSMMPGKPEYVFLPKDGSVDWDCYCTNYRDYFVPRTLKDGTTVYCVDHENEPPRVRNLAEAKDAYTVLAVGDSFTYGLGVKVEDNWPKRLETLLPVVVQEPVVVNNQGLVGRHVMEVLEGQYRPVAKEGIPDLCVYGWCLNDPIWQPAANAERTNPLGPVKRADRMETADIDDFINIRTENLKQLQMESAASWMRKRSRLVDFLATAKENYDIHHRTRQFFLDLYDPNKNGTGLNVTWNAVNVIRQTQDSERKRFLVVIFPMFVDLERGYPLEEIHTRIASSLTQIGVEFLDLLPIYRKYKTADLIVHPVDRHPNDVAHRIAAEAICEYLKSRK